jgi:hypothetical protein
MMTDGTDSGGSGGNVVALRDDDLDASILRQRLAGLSIRRIGKEFKLSDRAVLDALDRALPPLNPEMRTRLFKEDLCRLDELLTHWYAQARNGGAMATQLCIKIMERRSALCGLDAPATMRMEVIQHGAAEQPNSTQLLLDQLNRIVAERQQLGELVVETEAERDAGCRAEGPPDPPPSPAA